MLWLWLAVAASAVLLSAGDTRMLCFLEVFPFVERLAMQAVARTIKPPSAFTAPTALFESPTPTATNAGSVGRARLHKIHSLMLIATPNSCASTTTNPIANVAIYIMCIRSLDPVTDATARLHPTSSWFAACHPQPTLTSAVPSRAHLFHRRSDVRACCGS